MNSNETPLTGSSETPDLQVQVLLSAPLLSGTRRHRYLKPNIKFRAPVYFPRIAMGISSETAADQATP